MKFKPSTNLFFLLLCSFCFLSPQVDAQDGVYDVRFKINSVNCTDMELYVDIEIRADAPGTEFRIADQNYRFTFNSNALANPQIDRELAFSGFTSTTVPVVTNSFFSPHTLTGSLGTLVSYNVELSGGDGYPLESINYVKVGRVKFDIVDLNACVDLKWHTKDPADFPPTYIGEKYPDVNGTLDSVDEGSYGHYQQCLGGLSNNPLLLAIDDSQNTSINTPISFNLLNNDMNIVGAPSSITLTSSPAEGSASLDANGLLTFTPNTGFTGSVSPFSYEICDANTIPSAGGEQNTNPVPQPDPNDSPIGCGLSSCSIATINITVLEIAAPPIAMDDNAATEEDTAIIIEITDNDSDPNGPIDPCAAVIISPPNNGTVVIGVPPTCRLTYSPNPDYNGPDSFSYQICDTDGLCDQAVVTINVNPVNDSPVIVNDQSSTQINVSVLIPILANDSDIDGVLDTGTIGEVTPPSNGSILLQGSSYLYTPDLNFTGADSFTYTVCDDGLPVECGRADVFITVVDSNQPPTANDDSNTTVQGGNVNGDLSTNDSDPDGDPLVYNAGTFPTQLGTIIVNTDGTYTYTSGGLTGTDSYIYTVCDPQGACATATLTLTINIPPNLPPVANDDTENTDEDMDAIIMPTMNDVDPDGTIADKSLMVLVSTSNGSLTNNSDGSLLYIPTPDFNGADSFSYSICDDGIPVLCDTATVYLTIAPINDPPIALDDSISTTVGSSVSGDLSVNDYDIEGDLLTYTAGTFPTMGSTITINSDGSYTYTNLGTTDNDSYTYMVCDPVGACASATLTITILGLTNLPPVAIDDSNSTEMDTPVVTNVLSNDFDADGLIDSSSLIIVSPTFNGTLTNLGNGAISYTPAQGFTGLDSFSYSICDDGTPALCDTATVFLVVTSIAANNPPIAQDDSNNTEIDTPVSGSLSGNDSDPDGDQLSYTATTITSTNGVIIIDVLGNYTYTPSTAFCGIDSYAYEVCDDGTPTACSNATITIDVNCNTAGPCTQTAFNTTAATADSLSKCCYYIDISNARADYFTGVGLTAQNGVNLSFEVADIHQDWLTIAFGSDYVNLAPATTTNIPTGQTQNLIKICLDDYVQNTQTVELAWYGPTYDLECRDTLSFNCRNCAYIENDTITCDLTETSLAFYITNPYGTGYAIESYHINVLSGGGLETAPYAVIPTIPEGTTAGPFFATLDPSISLDTFCYNITVHSDDIIINPAAECCTTDASCLAVPQCDPCAFTSLTVSLDEVECCSDITLTNDFADDYFVGIETEVLTEGVYISAINNSFGSGWIFDNNTPPYSVSNVQWDLIPPMGDFLPVGDVDLPNFCLGGYSSDSTQVVEVRWIGLDGLVCRDTLTFSCNLTSPTDECSEVLNGSLSCGSNNDFIYDFNVANYSNSNFNTLTFHSITPGVIFDPNPKSLGSLLPNQTSGNQSIAISGTAAVGGATVCFQYSAHEYDLDSIPRFCCTPDSTYCVVLPNCIGNNCNDLTNVNDPPMANGDAYIMDENQTIVLDMLTNDCDAEETLDPCNIAVLYGPINGTLSNQACALSYAPNVGFCGEDIILYEVCDTEGLCSTSATINITINCQGNVASQNPYIKLRQNPVNNSAIFDYYLPNDAAVSLVLYDITGRKLQEPIRKQQHSQGIYSLEVDVRKFPTGVFLYRFESATYKAAELLTIIR